MKKTNKIFSVILSILMVISIIPISASAAAPTSGTCGDNVTWEFDGSILTISGTGYMDDYTYYYHRPWESYQDDIEKVIINKGVTSIGRYAFYDCDFITSVTIPDSVRYIDVYAFESCQSITSVVIPNSVIEIGDSAFLGCTSLMSITIPNSVMTIGNSAFTHCTNLTNVIISEGVTEIGYEAFSSCTSLTSVTIPNSVIAIGDSAFSNCTSLTSIIIPNSITVINTATFNKCTNLTSVTIPDSVTKIDGSAFNNCNSLTDVYYSGTEQQWMQISINLFNWNLTAATIHYIKQEHTHEYKSVVTASTCTEQGFTTYTCECGDIYIDDYVDALGHTEEIIPAVEPTCTETGLTEGVKCSVCGDTITEQEIVPETGHAEEIIPAVAPTCTETGLTEGTKCSVCGETLTEQKELPANGHTPANAIEENYVLPTCIENGSKDVVVYCSLCGEEISRESITIESTGHADNDNDGYCDKCDEQICDHVCHSDNFFRTLFWKIINFFNKLFGLNKVCNCGVAHY